MAETRKRKSSGKASAPSRRGGERAAPASKTGPLRGMRELGGVACLLLAFFAGIGYFNAEGLFINLFHDVVCGLTGWGFWITPPVLLLGAHILFVHRSRPVRLRLVCALCLPVLLGALLHLLFAKGKYPWGWGMFLDLWKSGLTMDSGGTASGWLAEAFSVVFSQVGAVVLLTVLLLLAVLGAFNRTVLDAYELVRGRIEDRRAARRESMEWEEQPEPEEAPAHPPVSEGKRRRPADIPVEDGPLLHQKGPVEPVATVRRKRLFERASHVPAPDKVLTGEPNVPVDTEKPQYEDVPELRPVPETETDPSHAASTPVLEANEQELSIPEIVREPAVTREKREKVDLAVDQVSQEIESAMAQDRQTYRYPPLSLLEEVGGSDPSQGANELVANQVRLDDALQSFGVEARIVNVTRGPSVARYELELEQGVKLNKITNLADDIALSLGATAVRIAPIPDKISTVGIEVPNKQVSAVPIRDVIGSKAFTDSTSKVSFSVGKDIGGNPVVGNIAKLPHMLIAGTTGSGKSVCTNSLIISLLYKATPEEVRLIMVDPKMVELGVYNGIPHLLIPVVTDPKKAAGALQWAVNEMMKRYRMFSEVGAKDLASYNNHARKREDMEPMPQIVVVIDELADLMLVAAKEVEESICRVAQMGRASGMHLVIATQRPSADVITGLMKANIPSRIAFAVASSLESRIILDQIGAEKLVGKGDMLYFPQGSGKPQRVQGCFISEEEVAEVVAFIKENSAAQYDEAVLHEIEQHAEEKEKGAKGVGGPSQEGEEEYDELLPAAIDVVLEVGQASVSMLQRRLKLGYGRAARLVDQMEEKGVVGPFEGSKPRQLLITKEQWQEMQLRRNMAEGMGAFTQSANKETESAYAQPVPEEFPYEGDAVEQSENMPPFDFE